MKKDSVSYTKSGLPIVGFDRSDELTVETYLAKAKALTGKDHQLTPGQREKLEYSLRVFKGHRAAAALKPKGKK